MNVVPVAHQCEYQQKKGDQQKSGRFRRVDRMAMVLVIVLGEVRSHADIVAPKAGRRSQSQAGTSDLGYTQITRIENHQKNP